MNAQVNQILMLLYALLAMSVTIALFGIVNTLVLSVYERTREIGMLRAIGTTRRQVRRMVRYESVITSVIGADPRHRRRRALRLGRLDAVRRAGHRVRSAGDAARGRPARGRRRRCRGGRAARPPCGADRLGPWLSAFAYGTTYFSAVLFVGYAGKVGYGFGLSSLWIVVGNALLGSLLAWLVLASARA
jgi:hypothetical protein